MPSIVTGLTQGDELVQCEQFGPLVPIIAFDQEDEAVELANQTEFGLAASVWDDDVDHGFAVARRIEAGTVFLNVHRVGASDVAMEFGGFKQSGVGRGHGWAAVEESSELQVLAHRPGWVEATGHRPLA
jgi:acyl-CoA reductase-like NAD-dependent aldehyde dehydrogenase